MNPSHGSALGAYVTVVWILSGWLRSLRWRWVPGTFQQAGPGPEPRERAESDKLCVYASYEISIRNETAACWVSCCFRCFFSPLLAKTTEGWLNILCSKIDAGFKSITPLPLGFKLIHYSPHPSISSLNSKLHGPVFVIFSIGVPNPSIWIRA